MNNIYKRRLKAIRPFVNFNYDLRKKLTPAQKGKITRYYNEIKDMTDGQHYIYRPRSKKNLKLAKTYTDSNLPDIKVAFIPTHGKAQVKFTKNQMKIKTGNVTETYLPVNKETLVINPLKAAEDAIKGRKEDAFKIQAGKYEISGTHSAELIGREIERLGNAYNSGNNSAENWLHGVKAYSFQNQADYSSYNIAKEAAKRKRTKARRKRKRKK